MCVLFCAIATHAQTKTPNFTLKELIALVSNNDEYFDTYSIGKGFEFLEAGNKDGCEKMIYTYGASGNREFVSQSLFKNNCENFIKLSWSPQNIKGYTAIKNELKANGFKFIEKWVGENGSLNFEYKKGNIKVSLGSFENENRYGDKKTAYMIMVYRYK